MTQVEDICPIVPVADIARTADFYEQVLGFERRFVADDGTFALMVLGPSSAMQFVKTDDADVLKATASNISAYLWTTDVDALYAELKPKLDDLPEGRVRPPFDQPYGMREFHVKDPDGCLLFFGKDKD